MKKLCYSDVVVLTMMIIIFMVKMFITINSYRLVVKCAGPWWHWSFPDDYCRTDSCEGGECMFLCLVIPSCI